MSGVQAAVAGNAQLIGAREAHALNHLKRMAVDGHGWPWMAMGLAVGTETLEISGEPGIEQLCYNMLIALTSSDTAVF